VAIPVRQNPHKNMNKKTIIAWVTAGVIAVVAVIIYNKFIQPLAPSILPQA
jgi:uncharacterized membrane protein YvbJ